MAKFALVEESAVAKGVRRVVGVTGELAAQALSAAETLTASMTTLSTLDVAAADTVAIEENKQGLAALKVEVDTVTTSAHVKAQLRESLSAREKLLNKRLKELQAGAADKLAAAAVDEAVEKAEAGESYLVLELTGGIDGKAMQPLVKKVVKASGLPTLALSATDGKVNAFALVPDECVDTLAANAWLKPVLAEVGGKGGGKAEQAQGSGPQVDAMPKAAEVARAAADEALGAGATV